MKANPAFLILFCCSVNFVLLLQFTGCSGLIDEISRHDHEKDKGKDKDKDNKGKDKDNKDDKDKGKQSACPADDDEVWSYGGKNNGPDKWGERFPACNGENQSPIAIYSAEAVPDENLSHMHFYHYDKPLNNATLENNGHTVKLSKAEAEAENEDEDDDECQYIIANGHKYKFLQLHFHWGNNKSGGSEHTLDDVSYPLELHIVHSDEHGNLAVVGVFFEQQQEDNPDLEPIIQSIKDIKHKDTKTNLTSPVFLSDLVPENPSSFYRYSGSLTTPDCREGVEWRIVPIPKHIGNNQIRILREPCSTTEDYDESDNSKNGKKGNGKANCNENGNCNGDKKKKSKGCKNCKLSNNNRPLQPLNNRTVYSSQ